MCGVSVCAVANFTRVRLSASQRLEWEVIG